MYISISVSIYLYISLSYQGADRRREPARETESFARGNLTIFYSIFNFTFSSSFLLRIIFPPYIMIEIFKYLKLLSS